MERAVHPVANLEVCAVTQCGAQWIQSAEVFCTREPGHLQGHIAKAEILYEDGQIGKVEISWAGYANLPPGASGSGG